MPHSPLKTFFLLLVLVDSVSTTFAEDMVVDFAYRPHQWRTAICPPDDTYKTLVTEEGVLLYHYGRVNADFATSVRVVVDDGEKIVGQKMIGPRLPIVQTRFEAGNFTIVQEAFAAEKQLPEKPPFKIAAVRTGMPWERNGLVRNWAELSADVTKQLATIAGGNPSPIYYQIKTKPGASAAVAVALCEGWHDQIGQRVLDITVEGASPRTVDTVADLGKNVAGLFWFDAKDVNRDGLIDLSVKAAKDAKDKNTILNGFWVFEAFEDTR